MNLGELKVVYSLGVIEWGHYSFFIKCFSGYLIMLFQLHNLYNTEYNQKMMMTGK
jgi:hypothetical protein